MTAYFERNNVSCLCFECFYGINVLKWDHLKVYRNQGVDISEGTVITPSLVNDIMNICQKLFKYHYNLTPQSLQDICARKIFYHEIKDDLLPVELKKYCRNFCATELPVWYPEWAVPSVLIRHLEFSITFKQKHQVQV